MSIINTSRKQVAFAVISAYLVLTLVLIFSVFTLAKNSIQVENWAVGIVSSIWGSYTTIVSLIMGYYFGDTAQTGDHNATLNKAIESNKSKPETIENIMNRSLNHPDNLQGSGDDTLIQMR